MLDVLWTADGLGHGFATVAIARGTIYTAGDVADDTVITAIDLDAELLSPDADFRRIARNSPLRLWGAAAR